MSPYNQQEIEDRFARLPDPLKEQMMSVENSERIFEAGKKFGLTIEQIGFLAEESGYVVLGLTHPKDFVAKLKDHLRVDEEKAKTIAKEINHHVFFPLREILKTTHQFELIQEEIQTPPPPIPSPPRMQPPIQKPPPIIQNQARSVEGPAFQNEVKPSTRQAVPIVVFPTPPTSFVSPVSSTPPVPPFNKPIVSPPAPPAGVKLPAIPIPTKPLAPQIFTPPPTRSISPQKTINPSPLSTVISLPQNTSPSPAQDKQGLIVNLKTAAPISSLPTPPPPAIQTQDKPRQIEQTTIQSESHSIGQSMPSAMPKSLEGIKPKEEPTPVSVSPVLQQIPQAPLPPSQIMQKKFLEETKTVKIPPQSPVERMKESLFAPPSAPLQPKPAPPSAPQSPPKPPPVPVPTPPIKDSSSSYAARDPYREPID